MCKHIAAVLYGVGARLDHQPELLFTLRQVDHLELIDEAVAAESLAPSADAGRKTIAETELADVFGIELDQAAPAAAAVPTVAPAAAKRRRHTATPAQAAVVPAQPTAPRSGVVRTKKNKPKPAPPPPISASENTPTIASQPVQPPAAKIRPLQVCADATCRTPYSPAATPMHRELHASPCVPTRHDEAPSADSQRRTHLPAKKRSQALRGIVQERRVRLRKTVINHLDRQNPPGLNHLQRTRLPAAAGAEKRVESHPPMGIRVLNNAQRPNHLHAQPGFFENFPQDALARSLVRFAFPPGKFPVARENRVCPPLTDEKSSSGWIEDQRDRNIER